MRQSMSSILFQSKDSINTPTPALGDAELMLGTITIGDIPEAMLVNRGKREGSMNRFDMTGTISSTRHRGMHSSFFNSTMLSSQARSTTQTIRHDKITYFAPDDEGSRDLAQ
jgi:hypothetical protein